MQLKHLRNAGFYRTLLIGMKIKQTVLIIVAVIGLSGVFVSPAVVSAAAKCGTVTLKAGESCCGGVVTSIISCDQKGGKSGDPSKSGVWGLLLLGINILTAGVGIAAVGGIVVGSYMYMTAGGSPDRVKKANIFLTNTILGVVVYAAMYALLNFIIPGGLFS